jgi:hypothetical protein
MRTYRTLLAIAGTLILGVLFLADLNKLASFDSHFDHKLRAHSAVDGTHPAAARPDDYLKRITEDSPYMRDERY